MKSEQTILVNSPSKNLTSSSSAEQKTPKPRERPTPPPLEGPPIEVEGLFEASSKGFGFLRKAENHYQLHDDDIFVPPNLVSVNHIRKADYVKGTALKSSRGYQLSEIIEINGCSSPSETDYPFFEELKAVFPQKRFSFETDDDVLTTRVIDLVAPVGFGQRGLIVAPPRSGKTTLLIDIAKSIQEKYEDEVHLIILLVDERPEEVTEFRRTLPQSEIFAGSNNFNAKNHCRLAEICIERAKRLVEAGKDVFILMDSITRLARAYNNQASTGNRGKKKSGGYQSGGISVGALEMPRRLFAAARNTREAGSLTILATALVQTNSKADEAIFQEFKGTGNMELVLDRKIAEQYIYPAVDIFKSGTRREELLLPRHVLNKLNRLRRGLAGQNSSAAIERLLFILKKFPNNSQMLLEIK